MQRLAIRAAATRPRPTGPCVDCCAIRQPPPVTSAQLDLLLRRVRLTFPRSEIVIGCWEGGALRSDGSDERIGHAESVASLIGLVGRKADEKSHKAEQTSDAVESAHRHLQVAAGA